MELEETGKSQHSIPENEDDKYYSDLQLDSDLPDLIELQITENTIDLTQDRDAQRTNNKPSLGDSSTCSPDDDEHEGTVARFVFTCKVCLRTFPTLKSCERHIICRGHTYPLIGLLSSDTMNGETFDRIVMPNSLDQREFKTIPSSDFLPIYMGRWSKVICELRHRFGQDSNYADSAHFKDYVPHTPERYNQPDVTQTQPKALDVSPHGEIARTMKKLNECFQTRSSDGVQPGNKESDERSHETSNSENPEITINGELDDDFHSNENSENPEKENGDEYDNDDYPDGDLIDLKPYHNAETLPRVDSDKSNEHKIYVDFGTEALVCEACCNKFSTLNDAIRHWKILREGGDPETDAADVGENIQCQVDCAINPRFNSENELKIDSNEIHDDLLKTDGPTHGDCNETFQRNSSPDKKQQSDEILQDGAETDEKSPGEWGSNEETGDPKGDDTSSESKFIPSDEKQNGASLYDTSFVREEMELRCKEDKVGKKKNKKDKKGKKKKRKNKPLKYIRRAFMMTVMFLF